MNAQKPLVHEPISHLVRQSRNQAQSIVPAIHSSDDRVVLSIQTDNLSAPIAVQSSESSDLSGDRTVSSTNNINPSTHAIVRSRGMTDDTRQANDASAHLIHPLAGMRNPITPTTHLQSRISAHTRPYHRLHENRLNPSLDAAPSPKAITIQSVLHLENELTDSRIRKTIELIRENLHLPISLEKLARHVNLSASRLRNLFCQVIGIPIAQFIRLFRLEMARQLLRTEFLTIKEVMAKTGIHDPSHFNRDFKLAYGVTPAQYRNQSKCSDGQAFPFLCEEKLSVHCRPNAGNSYSGQ